MYSKKALKSGISESNTKIKDQIGKRRVMIAYMNSGFKKFALIHNILFLQLNRCQEETNKPEWITKAKTPQIQKGLQKVTILSNKRQKTCILVMWKF